jgi:hypothetical protein
MSNLMVLKLRQQYFAAFEATYSFAKDLYKLMGKNKQHWQINSATQGMQIILKDLRRIWQYDAENDHYIQLLGRSLVRVNILIRRLQSGKIRELLDELYQQLLELLPPDINVQLSLFEFGSHALGFVSTCCAFRPLDFVVDFLRSAWVATRDWWHFSTPFFGYQGKQLTLIQA